MDRRDLERVLVTLVEMQGSDLHVKVGSPPRVRVSGRLVRLEGEPDVEATDVALIAAEIMPARIWEHFEQNFEADFAYSVAGLGRFRVNAFRQRGSVGLVLRHVQLTAWSLEDLGLPDAVRRLAEEPRGIVLVGGPTGCGKTTTLASMIDHINNTRECHIVTIEDPIEVLHRDKLASINQREVGFDTVSFAAALRGALREDPDVILVGEMRDQETVSTALIAAETGHLVVSTLHTNDSVETINRIISLYPPSQQQQARHSLAGVLRGTICQRLIPAASGQGRVPAIEIMIANGRIAQCIANAEQTGDIAEIVADGEYYGMQTFAQSLTNLVKDGRITIEAAVAATANSQDLRVMLQREGMSQSVLQ